MSLKLPQILETYLKASNNSDLGTFISCFSETATVLDEGETIQGHEAITKWFTKTRKKYQFKSEPVSIENTRNGAVLTALVSGNFPGSPVTLNYSFTIDSGVIQDLRII